MNKKLFFFATLAVMLLASLTIISCNRKNPNKLPDVVKDIVGIEKFQTKIDYSKPQYWAALPTETTKAVDVFYIYPTVTGRGATDIGVIVSWNTEGPGNHNSHNPVVLPGAVSINPINWKRDGTYAPASVNPADYAISDAIETFGPEGYHGQDYAFFYNNIRQNVADRINAWMSK